MGTEEEPPLFTPHWDPGSSLVRVGKGVRVPGSAMVAFTVSQPTGTSQP